jgi:carnitine O-acetyltransferase
MKEAVDGYGCDRLLLGLKMICLEKGWELPEIYKDPAFSRSSHWAVSTSQLSSEGFYVGFGPVVDDGYGVCYSIRDNMVTLTVSSHEDNPTTPVEGFYKALHESLLEMQTLCEAAAPAKPAKAKL